MLYLKPELIKQLNNLGGGFPRYGELPFGEWSAVVQAGGHSFFSSWLTTTERNFTAAEITAGLEPAVYLNLADLQSNLPVPITTDATPAPANAPNFALIYNPNSPNLDLAYWDFSLGVGGSWQVTSYPWAFPFLNSGPVINLLATNGSGNSAWNYCMGSEYEVLNAGRIQGMYLKSGSGTGVQHRWEIRKSTAPGTSAPSLASYTNIVGTGIHTIAAINVWESVGVLSIPIAVNDWLISIHYIGVGGQNANVTTLRGSGQLVEDYAELVGGVYAPGGGPNPGSNPLLTPSTRAVGTIYGVSTLDITSL